MDVDLWGWFDGIYWEAIRSGQRERRQLVDMFYRARDYLETNPQQALAFLQQGRDLARLLSEPCVALFYDYWISETYLFYLDDVRQGMDHAIRASVAASKPAYQHCPVRARVYRVLVDAYMIRDPVGYVQQIEETTAFMEREIPLDDDTRYLLQARRVGLAFAFDRLEDATEQALRFLALCDGSLFQQASAYAMLCRFAYLRGDLAAAQGYADDGERSARLTDRKGSLASLLAWQALLALKRGATEEAAGLQRQAVARAAALGRKPYTAYYDAMCDYYELTGAVDQALALREQELADAINSGSPHSECECRLKCCKLFQRSGQQAAFAEALAQAREAAKQLLAPAHFLGKLDGLLQA